MPKSRLRVAVLRASGSVALMAAAVQVLTGVRGVLGGDADAINVNVDSELRFYASWYAVAGGLMYAAAANPALDRSMRPAIEVGWALAALSRLLSARSVGKPQPFFIALGAIEAGLAATLIAVPPDRR